MPAEFAVFDRDLDEAWADRYLQADALAVDTEAMGLVHGRDRLCLVQVADQEDRVACVRIALGQSEAPQLRWWSGRAGTDGDLREKSSCAVRCSPSGSAATSPKSVTRAFASPLHPGICTVSVLRASARRFRACTASGLSATTGWPTASTSHAARSPDRCVPKSTEPLVLGLLPSRAFNR